MKRFFHKFVIGYFDTLSYRHYKSQFKSYLHNLGCENKSCPGEDEYMRKWRALSNDVEPYSYRLFSQYCGNNPYIVPEGVARRCIEPVLNPPRFRSFYGDKNMYAVYLNKNRMPTTILRRIGGGTFLDADFTPNIDFFFDKDGRVVTLEYDRLILKPSIDSSSGVGVMLFKNKGGRYLSSDGKSELTKSFLEGYSDDFILQEAVEQHPYISQFCKTAVNTLRIAVYRSVADESVNVVGAVLRIGRDGSFVDNGHRGGRFVGVNLESGALGHYVCDQYGNKATQWNGVDFSSADYSIPNWPAVVDFAKYVGRSNHHMRWLALDVALGKDGSPCLIEYNCGGFSYWLFQFSGMPAFGRFTDEIIDYCSKRKPQKAIIIE